MQTIKSTLQNLNIQISILLSFFLENEILLSNEILSIMDKMNIDLSRLFDLQHEVSEKIFIINTIETILQNPRYFMEQKPNYHLSNYTKLNSFNKTSINFNNFYLLANDMARAMIKANQAVIEKLPPLYQDIINTSRKNKQQGFLQQLKEIVYKQNYSSNFNHEYIRITKQITNQIQSNTSLQSILQTLNQPLE